MQYENRYDYISDVNFCFDITSSKWFWSIKRELEYQGSFGSLRISRRKNQLSSEDKLTADVSLTYANFQLDQLKKESFGYSCSEYIDGSTVYIKFFITEKNGKKELKAVAEADGQVIDVQLTRTNKQ